jgi:asparagine synthase (glutamine-hydrolysing)
MPGLFGFITKEPQALEKNRSILINMQKALLHENWYEVISPYQDHTISIGLVKLPSNSEGGIYHNRENNRVIAFEGLCHKLPGKENQNHKSFVEYLSKLHLPEDEDISFNLNGEFNFLIYEPQKFKLRIINDRFGYRNLYFAETSEAFVFASEVKAVIEHPGVNLIQDKLALADFLNIGYVFGNKTMFQGVKLMNPGSILEVTAHKSLKMKQKAYWDLCFKEENKNLNDQIDEGYSLFVNNVKRRIEGKKRIFVPLSGGLDSRLLINSLCEIIDPSKVKSMTWGASPHCIDHIIAKQVADALGISNHGFETLTPEFIYRYSPKQIWLSDGMIRGISSQQLFLVNRFGSEIDIWLNGILGGNFTFGTSNVFDDDDIRPPRYPSELEDHAFDRYRREWGFFKQPIKDTVLNTDLANCFDDRIKESIHDAAELSYGNPLLCDQKVHFKHVNMSRRLMNNVAVHKAYVNDQKVFYDYDLLDFFVSLNPRLRNNHKFYKAMMLKKCSSLANISWQSTLKPLNKARNIFSVLWKIEDRFKRRVHMKTRGRIELERRLNYLDFNYWFRKDYRFREYLCKILLDKRAIGRGIFKEQGLRNLFELQMRGGNHIGEILVLYSYEMFARQFFDKDLSEIENVKIGPFK